MTDGLRVIDRIERSYAREDARDVAVREYRQILEAKFRAEGFDEDNARMESQLIKVTDPEAFDANALSFVAYRQTKLDEIVMLGYDFPEAEEIADWFSAVDPIGTLEAAQQWAMSVASQQ